MSTSSFIVAAMRRGCTRTFRQPVPTSLVQCCLQSTQQPISAARLPCRVKVSAGKRYAWCACGHSKKQVSILIATELTNQKLWRSFLYASPLTKTGRSCCVPLSTLPSEPVIPSKKPFKVELIGGKRYSWCTCGQSKKQPFCDGAHKTRAQGLSPLRFVPEKDATVWLCGCKYTNNQPYCDGTHKQDFIISALLHEHTD
ncbi:uncharacterized protein LOC115008243 isoform X1 [Cottoperca gobio]|uniref:Uncharacterized protein LOC115008243 isoform X1 n=1 Tax=Cottoperca gobio TaxID=56716 RepID=A0A6J2PRM5_COTGO|nr:CDGSH iron-sulfur domain-containing protein 3, mitochondrial isoform X1 [Cottoperca gobio]